MTPSRRIRRFTTIAPDRIESDNAAAVLAKVGTKHSNVHDGLLSDRAGLYQLLVRGGPSIRGALAHGIGRMKGGRNTKLHAVCNEKGRPCVLLLTPGNVHNCKVAQRCIEAMPPSAHLVADKGYDSQALREWLEERGTDAVIPPRKNRKIQYDYDRAIYKQRNVVERMFCRFKDWRRIATRFDRNLKNFMGAISLAAAVIWWL